ncbi:glycine zipper 2TM domain-containing protein [Noviherbaspirillum saxi]|uniref:Glycine zipper 2TM domain-containing protein n=1 Tax=Noviherbaspirillum saxi TaxID=2320863 RepID=A0A3A3FU79_9BURK|nr:glycine zipper 2TM domain-containing protein [Noviherbaspirillum saxi]RJF99100.1 glycine zipper 2TM domain-containing protein [Noviherbaspirillum saxi]
MWMQKTKIAAAVAAAIMLAACGSNPRTTSSTSSIPVTTTSSSVPMTTSSSATGFGVVQAIDVIPAQQASGGVGVGTVAGAVVGGVLGNQVGSGSGRTAATVAGVAGGALAGRAMENNSRTAGTAQSYRVAVRMDNGSIQTLSQDVQPGVQVGERVRLENGVIVERFR